MESPIRQNTRPQAKPRTPRRRQASPSYSIPCSIDSSEESDQSDREIFDKDVGSRSRELSPITPPEGTANQLELCNSPMIEAQARQKKEKRRRRTENFTLVKDKKRTSLPYRISRTALTSQHLSRSANASKEELKPKPVEIQDPVPCEYFDSNIKEIIDLTVDSDTDMERDSEMDDRDCLPAEANTQPKSSSTPEIDNIEISPEQNTPYWIPEFVPHQHKKKSSTDSLESLVPIPRKPTKEINEDILRYLKEPLPLMKRPGWVYVFRHGDHIKIGRSIRPYRRELEWQKCQIEIVPVSDEDEDAFDNYHIVETLLHKELQNSRRQFWCKTCEYDHKEWFRAKPEVAIEAVKKWRNWMREHNPVQDGKLTPYWRWKADKLSYKSSTANWQHWTQPETWDYMEFTLQENLSKPRRDWWFKLGVIATIAIVQWINGWIGSGLFLAALWRLW